MPRVPSASGARYSNGDITFWGKGEVAMLEENGLEHRDCPGQQAEAHWQ
ncbi:MAG: MliC family protein [Candidatus Competibacteraceae bacterium]|nr:MliC family protein [Candidatus Competibacteraceae bacterium]